MATKTPFPTHPYYPPELNLPHYQANDRDLSTLLIIFVSGLLVIFSFTSGVGYRFNDRLRSWDQAAMLWFVLCALLSNRGSMLGADDWTNVGGCLHCFFEGYFITHHASLAGRQEFFAQLWKEYSLSDSRYLSSDPFVLCIETITVFFWGPLSFVTAWLILDESAWRWPAQAMLSTAHLYGDVLYYATNLWSEVYLRKSYSRPEWQYYWGYFVIMNAFWIAIPSVLIIQSAMVTVRAVRLSKMLHANGIVKKNL